MNKIMFIGNVGRDPEMRYTDTGQGVTSFSVGVSNTYTAKSGEKVKETTWYRVSTWGKQAEICNQYVKKGMKVYVEGRLTPDKATGNPRIYTNGKGEPASSFEVNASQVEFLSKVDSPDTQEASEDMPF